MLKKLVLAVQPVVWVVFWPSILRIADNYRTVKFLLTPLVNLFGSIIDKIKVSIKLDHWKVHTIIGLE